MADENNAVINQLILSQLQALTTEVNNLREVVGRLKVQDEENIKNEQKFWAENWAPVKSDISDIKNRLTAIEATSLKLLEKRLDTLETKTEQMENLEIEKLRRDSTSRKISIALGAAAGGAIATLVKFLGM